MASVSVIVSTFNRGEHFLPRALRSIAAQTFRDWECIVVDDCSADATLQVVRGFCQTDPRFRYETMDQNSGYQCAPKNRGIRETTAPLIAYCDPDNTWDPTHLERLVGAIGDADLIYCDRRYANDPTYPAMNPPNYESLVGHDWDPKRILFENWIDTSDILHTRSSIVRLGGWDESVRRAADWNLMTRYAQARMKIVHLSDTLTTYYWHSQGNIGRAPLRGVAIWTLTKNRLWHLQQMLTSLRATIGLDFDHYILDQGSTDGTADFLAAEAAQGRILYLRLEPENIGISRGSNHLLDMILPGDSYSWIVKLDCDIVFQTPLWLERMVARWKDRHVLSPHILGLVDHPGGAPRTRWDRTWRLGYARHLGGACNVAPAEAWKEFGRWLVPAPAHGRQDAEFSDRLRDKGWALAYVEDIFARHLGNVAAEVRKEERERVV